MSALPSGAAPVSGQKYGGNAAALRLLGVEHDRPEARLLANLVERGRKVTGEVGAGSGRGDGAVRNTGVLARNATRRPHDQTGDEPARDARGRKSGDLDGRGCILGVRLAVDGKSRQSNARIGGANWANAP